MKLSTRLRIIIVTGLIGALFAFTQNINVSEYFGLNIDLNFDIARYIIISILLYIGTYWALNFKIGGERYITILLFPILGVIAGSFLGQVWMNFFNPGQFGQLSISIISTIFVVSITYISILTVNILNINYYNNVPLGQAARAAYFVISLIIIFILMFIIIGSEIFIIYKTLSMFLISLLIVYMCLWSIEYSTKSRLLVALSIAFIIGWGNIVLSVWPIDSVYITLILNLLFYFSLNMAMETRDRIGRYIWIEYFGLYAFILLVLIVLAEWGINGSLI